LETFKSWRSLVLRSFGAKIGSNSSFQASVKICDPWNLEVGSFSSVGPKVDCYNQGKIKIGDHTVISQKIYLCASTHDYTLPDFPLVCQHIKIGSKVWIAADAFVGPNVNIGDGAVVVARSAVFKDVEPWTVVGGNPSKMIKNRNALESINGTS